MQSSSSVSDIASLLCLKRKERRRFLKDFVVLELALLVHVDVLFQDVLLRMECSESFLVEASEVLVRVEMLGRLLVLMGWYVACAAGGGPYGIGCVSIVMV